MYSTFHSLRPDMKPNRIMVRPDYAVSPNNMNHYQSIEIRLIFKRKDEWKLGSSMEMVFWAHRTWADQWKGVLVKEHGRGWKYYKIDDWRRTYFGSKGYPKF